MLRDKKKEEKVKEIEDIKEVETEEAKEVDEIEEDDALDLNEEEAFKDGVVSNCSNLNIRKKPDKNADILKVVPEGEEVVIDMDDNTDIFYNVILKDGTEGFAMKEFIKLV